MTAYIILDIDVKNPSGYANYKEMAQVSVSQYGGKYLARGGKAELLEGDWEPKRIIVLEFPSFEQAKSWLDSPEYAPARELRHQYASSKAVIVEGLE